MGKHHLKLKSEPNTEEYIRKFFFRSIRSKVLQKLVLVYYNLFYNSDGDIAKQMRKRLGGLPTNKTNLAWSLKPEDIMPIIHCSERTAKEYIDVFKTIFH